MSARSLFSRIATTFLILGLFSADPGVHAQPMQQAADAKAFKAADTKADPEARLVALRQFLHDFPDSKRVDAAHTSILHVLLANHPDDHREIQTEAKYLIGHAKAGEARWNEENSVAYDLAEAPPNGTELRSAEHWVQDALKGDTEPVFTASMMESYVKYKAPPPTPAETHAAYVTQRASVLQTLAEVYFREGQLDRASSTLDEAATLNPREGSVYVTRGEVALARHQDSVALEDFELAEVYGGLTPELDPTFHRLFASAHGGSDASLDAEIDTRYRQLQPLPFTPAPHAAVAPGHTALLELFSGSGCEPCIGADLAVDGVVQAYPRREVVVLTYDLHAPLPDPLVIPDGVARAKFYGVGGTPTMFLDGQEIPKVYGTRDEAGQRYATIQAALDKGLSAGNAVGIELRLAPGDGPQVSATASIAVDAAKLKEQLAALSRDSSRALEGKTSGGAPPAGNSTPAVAAASPNAILNFALVQREISYTGENGVRFHPMVVRALAKPSPVGYPLDLAGSTTVTTTFDLEAVRKGLDDYLQDFATHNERFGPVTFHKLDSSLPLKELGIAAWVEDPSTHHILQAAFLPLSKEQSEAGE